MIELELLGIGGDGQSLVFTDDQGERYSVPITDELRAAARRDRPRIESVNAPAAKTLRPREIQALLRSGISAEEIASEHAVDVGHVRRFEAPVLAEMDFAITKARQSHVHGDGDAPVMEDLVIDRLAARGVDPQSLTWGARRVADGPWEISLTFIQGAAEHAAHWTMTGSSMGLDAIDQEAQWLTETVSAAPVSAIFTPLPVVQDADAEERRAREALLDQLNAARGRRGGIDLGLDDDEEAEYLAAIATDENEVSASEYVSNSDARAASEDSHTSEQTPGPQRDSISARIYTLAHARAHVPSDEERKAAKAAAPGPHGHASKGRPMGQGPITSSIPAVELTGSSDANLAPKLDIAPQVAVPRPVEDAPEDLASGDDAATVKGGSKRGRRRSVPSWDEIVFGSKN